ncbi:MAG: ABC transporter transmembrane domain-containing protein [Woeseiaceae bacterium]
MSSPVDQRTRVVYGRLWSYVTPHKLVGLVAVICMVATALVEAGLVYLLAPLTDETLVNKNLDSSRWIPYAFFGIFILRGLSGFGTELSLGWIGRRVISDLRREVFDKLLTLPAGFFDSRAAGPLLSRMSYNVEMVAESVTNVVTIAIRDVMTVIAAFGVMLWFSPTLTVFVAILFPVVAVIVRMLGVAFRRYSSRIQDSIGEVTQVTDEVVRGNQVVKAFGGYEYERERFEKCKGG